MNFAESRGTPRTAGLGERGLALGRESLLREIAGATPGGFYLPLRGATTMESLYEKGIEATTRIGDSHTRAEIEAALGLLPV